MNQMYEQLTTIQGIFQSEKLVEVQPLLQDNSKQLLFSFAYFDRDHELFNLGDHLSKPRSIDRSWFLDLLDSLKEASKLKIQDFKRKYDMHPLERDSSNIKDNELYYQYEYYSFDVTKASRVIGFKIDNRFYIQWLDKHHNHCNSEGYGKEVYYCRPLSAYEKIADSCQNLSLENEQLKEKNKELKDDNQLLLDGICCENCIYKLTKINA